MPHAAIDGAEELHTRLRMRGRGREKPNCRRYAQSNAVRPLSFHSLSPVFDIL
jgi:hypothetical protein